MPAKVTPIKSGAATVKVGGNPIAVVICHEKRGNMERVKMQGPRYCLIHNITTGKTQECLTSSSYSDMVDRKPLTEKELGFLLAKCDTEGDKAYREE